MTVETEQSWLRARTGPASVAQTMQEFEKLSAEGNLAEFQPMPTGFTPLDEVLNGGMRPGEMMVLGGPYGVGKTIFGLQIARNVVTASEPNKALYVCYEHDRTHLLSRLICLESAERGNGEDSLTLRKLAQLVYSPREASGLIRTLRQDGRYTNLMRALDGYSDRLILARASGAYTDLQEIQAWVQELKTSPHDRVLVVVDYIQKIAVERELLRTEEDVTTFLMHGLKELALSMGIQMIAIAAADRHGIQGQRMRLSDMRGSSAIQYETDIGLMLNNKYDIVSREHLIYNLSEAESMRSWVVMSMEKNRAGRHEVDMEYALDAPHFRFMPKGAFVRERLIDGKVVLA